MRPFGFAAYLSVNLLNYNVLFFTQFSYLFAWMFIFAVEFRLILFSISNEKVDLQKCWIHLIRLNTQTESTHNYITEYNYWKIVIQFISIKYKLDSLFVLCSSFFPCSPKSPREILSMNSSKIKKKTNEAQILRVLFWCFKNFSKQLY